MHSCEFVFRINGNIEYVYILYIYSALVPNQEEFSLSHPLVKERHLFMVSIKEWIICTNW